MFVFAGCTLERIEVRVCISDCIDGIENVPNII